MSRRAMTSAEPRSGEQRSDELTWFKAIRPDRHRRALGRRVAAIDRFPHGRVAAVRLTAGSYEQQSSLPLRPSSPD
ncbi:MAG TPA: hypothetical protein VH187_01415 [Scandinavium sp.]|nr:hypothetical protein [Scandinavium sp.]